MKAHFRSLRSIHRPDLLELEPEAVRCLGLPALTCSSPTLLPTSLPAEEVEFEQRVPQARGRVPQEVERVRELVHCRQTESLA